METFRFQIWTLEPLPRLTLELKPRILRKNFTFPAYPFEHGEAGPLPESVQIFFEKYQIIYYRDQLARYGILFTPAGQEPMEEQAGFLAYKYSGVVDQQNLAIVRWSPKQDAVKHMRHVKKHGDDYAWLIWEKTCTILTMCEERIEMG